jgi:hypothetical protein
MSVRATNALNAALNAENALLNGGTIVFTDGDLGTGNVLATFTLSATAFATSTANSAACNGLPASVTPSGSGTIAGWIAKTSGAATVLTGHASELTMSSKVVASGIAFTFTGWTRTAGAGS